MASPEQERLLQLTRRVREGSATEAEREELALYANESPENQALAVRVQRDGELGHGWIDRYAADRELVAEEESPLSLAERKVGVGLVVAGAVSALFVPPVGVAAVGLGAGLLAWSVVRVALKNRGKDPYGDIQE